ncbi:hypothetical protein NEISICOT_01662 [Neisseria sicca ATCC 29256]|uniref:Uncharacterized protein n=1 Tax=Neisseria sicca ATCC 29256 TaxID=547045 RepID=C6M563_NEISI|nr:hypothetical protein NEISICOT_01662 [Neisseria sicca ATCC 29256]
MVDGFQTTSNIITLCLTVFYSIFAVWARTEAMRHTNFHAF